MEKKKLEFGVVAEILSTLPNKFLKKNINSVLINFEIEICLVLYFF